MNTSLENKHLKNGNCFVIIVSSPHPLLLTEHAKNGLVKAPLKWAYLLLCRSRCPYNLRFGNFTLSFGRLRQKFVLKCVPQKERRNQTLKYYIDVEKHNPVHWKQCPARTWSPCYTPMPLKMRMRVVLLQLCLRCFRKKSVCNSIAFHSLKIDVRFLIASWLMWSY